MIDLFIKILDKGILLVKERQLNRKNFYTTIVLPIQEGFEKLYKEHILTFKALELELEEIEINHLKLENIISSNILYEEGTVIALSKATYPVYAHRSSPNENVEEIFNDYISNIYVCLIKPNNNSDSYLFGTYDEIRGIITRSIYLNESAGQIKKNIRLAASDLNKIYALVQGLHLDF